MEGGRNVGVTKAQAIGGMLAGRLSTESESVEGPKKKVPTPIAREHSTRAIGSVGCRCQPQDEQVSRFGPEGGNRLSPVGPIPECASLFSCHLLTMLDQSWAKSALDDLALNLAPFQFQFRTNMTDIPKVKNTNCSKESLTSFSLCS